MRVLWAVRGIYPEEKGGAQRHSYELARALSKQGVSLDILHPHGKPLFPESPWVNEEIPLGVPQSGFRSLLRYAKKAAVVIADRKTHYDICYSDGISLIYHTAKKTCPCLFNPHGMPQLQEQRRLNVKRAVYRHFNRKMAQNSDWVISLGGRLKDLIQDELGVEPQRIVTLPNGVPKESISVQPQAQPDTPTDFLFVGALNRHKGVEHLIRAASDTGFDDCLFRIVGGGPLADSLKSMGHRRNVEFIGRVGKPEVLRNCYRRSHCLILPSIRDGMPTVILEAMANGLPVIASDVGAVTEMVEQGRNGFICRPGSLESLVEALLQFRRLSRSSREDFSRHSLERAHTFTWEKISKRFIEFMNSMVKTDNLFQTRNGRT